MRGKTKVGIIATSCCLVILFGYLVSMMEIFPKNQLDSSLRKAIESKRGAILYIHEITPFKWDRLDIYTPYTSYKVEKSRKIDVDEGHCHLIFSENGIMVAKLKFKRYYGDFAGLYREGGYTPSTARFNVSNSNKGSWVKLE